jgi:hypothetical protein
MPSYNETGSTGLRQYSGFVEEAFARELRWPAVQPLYSRMRRSDPEISMVRFVFSALARGLSFEVQEPDDPADADHRASEFVESVLEDMDGGPSTFVDTLVSNVPFFGWGVWEIVPGLRSPTWNPPGDDDWRSQKTDGAVGIRRLGWRDSSSFYRWVFADNGKATGMVQSVFPNPMITLPLADCLHVTMGDAHNPEGLTPMEAVWRMERIKYGLEIVQGIGFEHSAGYLDVKAEQALTPQDKIDVRNAAKAVMTAQEGNYAVWPKGFTGELKDINYSAAAALLEAIKYYGVVKLQLFMSQWMALSATTGTGSQAAMTDSSSMFMTAFNSMMEGFAAQIDHAIVPKLAKWNPGIFSGLTAMPRITISSLGKKVSLAQLAQLLGPLAAVMPLGDDDFKAIRKLTDFLPENLPEVETPEAPEPEPEPVKPPVEDMPEDDTPDTEDDIPDDMPEAERQASLQSRWARYLLKHPEMMQHV